MNFFRLIEDKIFENEKIMFDEKAIQKEVSKEIIESLKEKSPQEQGFYFEKIVYDFFDYLSFNLTKTKKTRDFGLDGVIEMHIEPFGKIGLGLQIKYKIIDSSDIDKFIQALNYAELRLGTLICKDSRRLMKYELNSKLKAILFSRNIKTNLKLNKIDINPIFILKLKDIVNLVASDMRAVIRGIYKK